MIHRRKINIKRLLLVTLISLLVVPLLMYVSLCLSRPPRTDIEQQIFQGITYQREARSQPRSLMVHIITIDLAAPGLRFLVTPGTPAIDGMEVKAQTTPAFLDKYGVQLAINASFFLPFYERSPWNYYPHSGDRVNILGQAISEGNIYSPAEKIWPVLCISANNQVEIRHEKCAKGTWHAAAGNRFLLEGGRRIPLDIDIAKAKLMPSTAVAMNEQANKLWLVVVDGRQPFYSEGVNLAELTDIFIDLGAYTALNFDGGGSSTLAIAKNGKPTLLNAPIHTRLPMRQRPVANHLGIYALPVATN